VGRREITVVMNQISQLKHISTERTLVLLYSIGVTGAFLQIAGAQWDVSAHILGIVETFFTPAHAVLYSGIVLVAFANLIGLRLRQKVVDNPSYPQLLTGVRIATVGSILQFIAAPLDFWWHSTYGFDPFLFTPAHSILIVGMLVGGVGMALGSIRILQAQRTGVRFVHSLWRLKAMVVVALAAIWGQINFFGYWVTDLYGMAYTFGYCSIQLFNTAPDSCSFVSQYSLLASLTQIVIFGASGTLVFWASKTLFAERGMFTKSAALLSTVYSLAAYGFIAYALEFFKNPSPAGTWYLPISSPQDRAQFATHFASFLPIYLSFLIPVLLLDFAFNQKNQLFFNANRWRLIFSSALLGPFVALVEGRFAIRFSNFDMITIAIVAVATAIGGILGSILMMRISNKLLSNEVASQSLDLQ
jgi:hypothetical protein